MRVAYERGDHERMNSLLSLDCTCRARGSTYMRARHAVGRCRFAALQLIGGHIWRQRGYGYRNPLRYVNT